MSKGNASRYLRIYTEGLLGLSAAMGGHKGVEDIGAIRRSSSGDEDQYLAAAAEEADSEASHANGTKKHRLKTFFREGKRLLEPKEKDLKSTKDDSLNNVRPQHCRRRCLSSLCRKACMQPVPPP